MLLSGANLVKVMLITGALLFLTSCSAEQATTSVPTLTSFPRPTNTSGPRTPTPLSSPSPTPTPVPPGPITIATLGGTPSAFAHKYRDQGPTYPDVYEATINGLTLWLGGTPTQGLDGKTHYSLIYVEPEPLTTPDVWNIATAQALVLKFLPRDAQYEHDITMYGNSVEHVYISQDLALTFPASDFPAEDRRVGILAPPGIMEWECSLPADQTSKCILRIGAPRYRLCSH